MQQFFSPSAPKALGPYSHAVKSGNLLFLSGQTPIEPESLKIETNDIGAQTTRVLNNLQLVLNDAGLSFKNVVRVNVYLTNMASFQAMNDVYSQFFTTHKPARTTISVLGLPLGALVEIDCVAEIPNS